MGKKTAILAAMGLELHVLRRELRQQGEVLDSCCRAGLRFDIGRFRGKDVVVTASGMGKVNSAMAAQILAEHWSLDALILLGVAGSLSPSLTPGDVVVANRIHQFDAAIVRADRYTPLPVTVRTPNGGERHRAAIHCSERLVASALRGAEQVILPFAGKCPARVVAGPVISGDSLILWPEALSAFAARFEALAVDMESIAVAQVAAAYGVEFVVVRSISDVAAELATMELEPFYRLGLGGKEDNGPGELAAAARALVRKPGTLVSLLGLARNMRGASRNAALVVGELVASMP